jgi:hypothetical protein
MSIDSKGIAKRMYMDMDLLVDVSEGERQRVLNTLYKLKIGRLALHSDNRELLHRLTYLLLLYSYIILFVVNKICDQIKIFFSWVLVQKPLPRVDNFMLF